jgi:flagellar motor switch protein FliN/FliY
MTSPQQDPMEAAFEELQAVIAAGGEVPLGLLLDLTLPVSIELGRTSMTVQDVLRLGRGSVIQLERLAGEPIDIFVGVRLTRILSRKTAAEAAA